MVDRFSNVITKEELKALASIVQVGSVAYRELLKSENSLFTHPYFSGLKGRIWTSLVQMECEIESHESQFPFEFHQREFAYNQCIPELRTDNVILHIARSQSPEVLPYDARYKIELSNNNSILCRQLTFCSKEPQVYQEAPFYGLVVFGGYKTLFSTIQFPEPGFSGIADAIPVPLMDSETTKETFERKKATLKQKLSAQIGQEIS